MAGLFKFQSRPDNRTIAIVVTLDPLAYGIDMKSKLHLVLTSSSRYALVILILLAMPREDLKYMPTNNTAAEYKSRSTHVPAQHHLKTRVWYHQGLNAPLYNKCAAVRTVHASRMYISSQTLCGARHADYRLHACSVAPANL